MLKIILIALTIGLIIQNMEGMHLIIEEFKNITIAYMRRTGAYGSENKILMDNFKAYLKEQNLLNQKSILLGIALDDPVNTDSSKLRYDVGLVLNNEQQTTLKTRKIPNGMYAIFEIPHTEQAVRNFWSELQQSVGDLLIDETKPVIERYAADKIAAHLCEFCVPIKGPL